MDVRLLFDLSESDFDFVFFPNEIKQLNYNIKKDNKFDGTIIPSNLDNNQYILAIKYKNDTMYKIASFIWFGIYNGVELGKYLHINYSYTFVKFRNNGLNKKLRVQLEKICLKNNISTITSKPFDNSMSKNILLSLNYIQMPDYYCKKLL